MQPEKTILFLHGFYASGQCVPAVALREAFAETAHVLTPDLPLHPHEAISFIRSICDEEKPDVIVGNSCGAFYAQMIAPAACVPALLGNPHFRMSAFLRERIGRHQYKAARADGRQDFTIDEQLVSEFEQIEAHQFDGCTPLAAERVWGLFGTEDTLAYFEPLFLQRYTHSFHFPGGHTPTAEQVRLWYVPLIQKLLDAGGRLSQNERWQRQYDALLAFLSQHHRRPSKYDPEEKGYWNWWRRTFKQYHRGELPPERAERFERLMTIDSQYRRKNQWG